MTPTNATGPCLRWQPVELHRQHAPTGDPELLFILGRIRDAGQPHAQTVREAQVSVAMNTPGVYWFDTDDGLPARRHPLQRTRHDRAGHRFADIVLSLPNPAPSAECRVPSAQCPMPKAQCLMPNA